MYDLGNGTSVISTTDFFCRSLIILSILAALLRLTPSAYLRDGGQTDYGDCDPRLADYKLSPEIAREVTEGGRYACRRRVLRWLAVTPSMRRSRFLVGGNGDRTDRAGEEKQYRTSRCKLFLTKPLGIGVLTTAEKNHC